MLAQNTRYILGTFVTFADHHPEVANQTPFSRLDRTNRLADSDVQTDAFDMEANGPGIHPMSETLFCALAQTIDGFAEAHSGNYAGYLEDWFQKRRGILAPRVAMAQAWNRLITRKDELDVLLETPNAEDAQISLAERNVLVAREVYAWSSGFKAQREEACTQPNHLDTIDSEEMLLRLRTQNQGLRDARAESSAAPGGATPTPTPTPGGGGAAPAPTSGGGTTTTPTTTT